MELVYKQMYDWQNKLCDGVDSMRDSKKQKLVQQLDQLKTYRVEIMQGKKKYQELIDDPSLDVQYRKKQVVGMVDELLGRSEIPLLMVTQAKMEFGWNDQYLNTLLSHVIINDCDQPFPPHVMATVVRYSSAILQISIVTGDLGREVLEFAVEYAVLPKDEDTKLKLEYSPLDDASSFRKPSASDSRQSQSSALLQKAVSSRLSVAQSQTNVASKQKKKSKKKSDESDSEESKSDKSSQEDEDEDKSSKSGSESESDKSGSDKSSGSEKSNSEKSSGDSDEDESDSSGGKKKKKKKGKEKEKEKDKEKEKEKEDRTPTRGRNLKEVESKKNVTRLRSSSRSRSKSLSDHAAAPQLEAAPSNEEAGQNDKDDSDEGPTPQAKENEASKSGVNNENVVDESKSKPENESGVIQPEVGSDPISMKYAHLDLYWEKGGSMDL